MISWLISQTAFAQYEYAAWPPEVQPVTKPFANAGRLLNEAGRFWGVGYSEGYHACPSCSSGNCSSGNCSAHGRHLQVYPQLLTHLHPKLHGKNIVASNAPACSQCGSALGQGHHACSGSCKTNSGYHPPGVDQVGTASTFFWRSNVRYFHPNIAIPSSGAPPAAYGHGHAMPVESSPEGYVPDHLTSPSDRGPSESDMNPWLHAQPLPQTAEEVLRELPVTALPAPVPSRIPQAESQQSGQFIPPRSGAVPSVTPDPAPASRFPTEPRPSQLTPESTVVLPEPTGGSGKLSPQAVNPIPLPPLPGKELKNSSDDLLEEGEGTAPSKPKEISLLETSGDTAEGIPPADVSKEALPSVESKKQEQVVPAPPATPKPPEVKPSKDPEKVPAEEDLLSRRRNIIRQPTRR
jgi:hypothetical protein